MMVSFSSGFFSLLPPGEGPGMRDRAINEAPPFDPAAPLTLTLSRRERGLTERSFN